MPRLSAVSKAETDDSVPALLAHELEIEHPVLTRLDPPATP